MGRFKRPPTIAAQFQRRFQAEEKGEESTSNAFPFTLHDAENFVPAQAEGTSASNTTAPPPSMSPTIQTPLILFDQARFPATFLKLHRLYRIQFEDDKENFLLVRIEKENLLDSGSGAPFPKASKNAGISVDTRLAQAGFLWEHVYQNYTAIEKARSGLKGKNGAGTGTSTPTDGVGGGGAVGGGGGHGKAAGVDAAGRLGSVAIGPYAGTPWAAAVAARPAERPSNAPHAPGVNAPQDRTKAAVDIKLGAAVPTTSAKNKNSAVDAGNPVQMKHAGLDQDELEQLVESDKLLEIVLIAPEEEEQYQLENLEITLTARRQMTKRDIWYYQKSLLDLQRESRGPIFYQGFPPTPSDHLVEGAIATGAALLNTASNAEKRAMSLSQQSAASSSSVLGAGGEHAASLTVTGGPLGGGQNSGSGNGGLLHQNDRLSRSKDSPVAAPTRILNKAGDSASSSLVALKSGSNNFSEKKKLQQFLRAGSGPMSPRLGQSGRGAMLGSTPNMATAGADRDLVHAGGIASNSPKGKTKPAPPVLKPKLSCGVVVQRTEISFRSAAAEIFMFIEVSKELFDFSISGELLLNHMLRFLKDCIERQKAAGCEHELIIVLFGRQAKSAAAQRGTAAVGVGGEREQQHQGGESATQGGHLDWYDVVWHGAVSLISVVSEFIQALWDKIALYDPRGAVPEKAFAQEPTTPGASAASPPGTRGTGTQRTGGTTTAEHQVPTRSSPNNGTAYGYSPCSSVNNYTRSLFSPNNMSQTSKTGRHSSSSMELFSTARVGDSVVLDVDEATLPGSCKTLPLLEALNLALDAYEHHGLDRNLTITGQAIFVLSANHGVVFTKKDLFVLTQRRFSKMGARCFLVCFRERPLHRVPLVLVPQEEKRIGVDFASPGVGTLGPGAGSVLMPGGVPGMFLANPGTVAGGRGSGFTSVGFSPTGFYQVLQPGTQASLAKISSSGEITSSSPGTNTSGGEQGGPLQVGSSGDRANSSINSSSASHVAVKQGGFSPYEARSPPAAPAAGALSHGQHLHLGRAGHSDSELVGPPHHFSAQHLGLDPAQHASSAAALSSLANLGRGQKLLSSIAEDAESSSKRSSRVVREHQQLNSNAVSARGPGPGPSPSTLDLQIRVDRLSSSASDALMSSTATGPAVATQVVQHPLSRDASGADVRSTFGGATLYGYGSTQSMAHAQAGSDSVANLATLGASANGESQLTGGAALVSTASASSAAARAAQQQFHLSPPTAGSSALAPGAAASMQTSPPGQTAIGNALEGANSPFVNAIGADLFAQCYERLRYNFQYEELDPNFFAVVYYPEVNYQDEKTFYENVSSLFALNSSLAEEATRLNKIYNREKRKQVRKFRAEQARLLRKDEKRKRRAKQEHEQKQREGASARSPAESKGSMTSSSWTTSSMASIREDVVLGHPQDVDVDVARAGGDHAQITLTEELAGEFFGQIPLYGTSSPPARSPAADNTRAGAEDDGVARLRAKSREKAARRKKAAKERKKEASGRTRSRRREEAERRRREEALPPREGADIGPPAADAVGQKEGTVVENKAEMAPKIKGEEKLAELPLPPLFIPPATTALDLLPRTNSVFSPLMSDMNCTDAESTTGRRAGKRGHHIQTPLDLFFSSRRVQNFLVGNCTAQVAVRPLRKASVEMLEDGASAAGEDASKAKKAKRRAIKTAIRGQAAPAEVSADAGLAGLQKCHVWSSAVADALDINQIKEQLLTQQLRAESGQRAFANILQQTAQVPQGVPWNQDPAVAQPRPSYGGSASSTDLQALQMVDLTPRADANMTTWPAFGGAGGGAAMQPTSFAGVFGAVTGTVGDNLATAKPTASSLFHTGPAHSGAATTTSRRIKARGHRTGTQWAGELLGAGQAANALGAAPDLQFVAADRSQNPSVGSSGAGPGGVLYGGVTQQTALSGHPSTSSRGLVSTAGSVHSTKGGSAALVPVGNNDLGLFDMKTTSKQGLLVPTAVQTDVPQPSASEAESLSGFVHFPSGKIMAANGQVSVTAAQRVQATKEKAGPVSSSPFQQRNGSGLNLAAQAEAHEEDDEDGENTSNASPKQGAPASPSTAAGTSTDARRRGQQDAGSATTSNPQPQRRASSKGVTINVPLAEGEAEQREKDRRMNPNLPAHAAVASPLSASHQQGTSRSAGVLRQHSSTGSNFAPRGLPTAGQPYSPRAAAMVHPHHQMKDAMKEQDAAKKKATIEYISSEALEESERWVAARFEISDENPSYFKKAKLLSVQALFSVLHSPPLLPIFVERQLKKAETLGRKSDNWSCISPTKTEGARQLFEDLVGTRLLCGMQLFHTGGGGGVGVNLSPTSRALAGLNSVSSGIAAEGFSLASRLIVCNSDHNWELTHSGNTDQIFITQHDKRVPKYSNFGAVVGVARPSTTGSGQAVVGSGKVQGHNFQSGAGIPVAPALSAANEVARNGVKKNAAGRSVPSHSSALTRHHTTSAIFVTAPTAASDPRAPNLVPASGAHTQQAHSLSPILSVAASSQQQPGRGMRMQIDATTDTAGALRTSPAGSGSDNSSLLPEPADSPTNAERVDGAGGTEPPEKPSAAVHQYGSGYGNHQSPLLTASPPPPSHGLGLPAKAVSAATAVVAPASGAVGGGGVGAASATAARGSGSGAPAQTSPVSPHVDQITHPYQYVLRRSILRIANTRLQSMSDEEERSTSADGAASASSTTGAEGSPRFLEQFNRGDASPEIPVWSPECNLRGTSKASGVSTMPKGSLLGRQGASGGGEAAKAKQNQKQALGQDEERVLLATSLQNDQSALAFFEPSPTSAGLHNLLPRTKTDASEGSMMSGGNASHPAYDYGHGSGGPTSPTNWLSPTSNLRSLRHESLWSGFRRDSWTRQQRIFCQPDPMPWNIIDQIVSQAHPLPAATPYGTSKLNPENTTPWYRLRSVLKSIVFVLLPVDRAHRVETRQVKEGLALGEFPYLDSAAEGGSVAEEDDFFTCSPGDDEELLLSGAEEGDDHQDLLRPRSVSLEELDRGLGVDVGGGGLAGGRGGHPATGNSSRSSSSTSLAPDPPSSQLHDQSSFSGRLSSRARASRSAQAKRAARIKRQFAAFKKKLEEHVFANMPSTTSPSQGTPAVSKATTLSGGSASTPPGFVPELPIEISASARGAPLLPATDSANTDSGNCIGSSSAAAATTPAPAATTAPTSGGFCSKTLKVPIRWMEGWDHLSSSKNEWIQLNFDSAYSPEDPFHFSIEWILCSNHAAYRFVLFVLQIAQECGFAMHAVPHSQLFPQPSQRLAKAAVVPKSWNVMSAGEDFTLKRSPFFNRLSLRIPENIEYSRLVEMLVAPPLNLLLVYHMTNSEASGSGLSSCAVVGATSKVVEKEAVHFSGASSSKGPVTRSRSLGAAAESSSSKEGVVPYNAGAASRASPVPSVTNATFGTNEYDTSSGGSTAFWQRSFSPPATLHSASPPARAHVADTTAKVVTASVLQPGSTLRFGVDGVLATPSAVPKVVGAAVVNENTTTLSSRNSPGAGGGEHVDPPAGPTNQSSSNAAPRVSRTGDDDGGGSWIFMEPTSGLFFITVTQNHIFWTESKYLGRKPTKRLPEQLAATYEGRMDRKFREFKQVLEKVWQESKQVVMKIQEGGCGGGWASGFGSGLASSADAAGKTSFHLPPEIEMEELR